MQLYAFDEKSRLFFAKEAERQKDYYCLECKAPVRLRGGIHRQDHFFHLSANSHCRQNGKSLEHLQVQLHLQKIFGEKCQLEVPIPSIERIADVVYLPYKLVFEIQCSWIAAEEVEERNRDYRSLGYEVFWILHDQQFNQLKYSAAEEKLYPTIYYTNMDADGKGNIYDQYAHFSQGKRHHIGLPLEVDMSQIFPLKEERGEGFSSFYMQRLKTPFYFKGDLVYHLLHLPQTTKAWIEQMLHAEEKFPPKNTLNRWKERYERWICHPYTAFLTFLLQKLSS